MTAPVYQGHFGNYITKIESSYDSRGLFIEQAKLEAIIRGIDQLKWQRASTDNEHIRKVQRAANIRQLAVGYATRDLPDSLAWAVCNMADFTGSNVNKVLKFFGLPLPRERFQYENESLTQW